MSKQTDLYSDKKCVHYCSVGGHLWEHHTTRDKNGISNCDWKMNDMATRKPVIKFFSVCLIHRDLSEAQSEADKGSGY